MSNNVNTELLERAAYVSEQYVGTRLPEVIDRLVKKNDLAKLEYIVSEAEQELARGEDAYPGTRMEATDAY